MAHLNWCSDLNTGIDVIDGQHKQIVDYINRLNTARSNGDRQEIGDIIEGMVDYTLSHFAFEETLMSDAQYQFLHGHQKIHEIFVNRINRFHERFVAGEEITDELHALLCRWLFNHIRSDDAAYVGAVKTSMLKLVEEKHEGGWLSRSLNRFFGTANA